MVCYSNGTDKNWTDFTNFGPCANRFLFQFLVFVTFYSAEHWGEAQSSTPLQYCFVFLYCRHGFYQGLFILVEIELYKCDLLLLLLLVLLLPPLKEVMFLVRFVCLTVRRITEKVVNGF